MPARQLRFFEHPKPLLELLGGEFFRSLPPGPGVYIMRGESGQILYVGQSKNLRQRLATYKNAHPDHLSRKMIRLVHAVRRIDCQECANAALARVRENELLRVHRPKFNSVNTYPQAYCFVGVKLEQAELRLWITTRGTSDPSLHGAFKPRAARAYAALLRLLWAAIYQPAAPGDFPRRLVDRKPPPQYSFSVEEISQRLDVKDLLACLELFLGGLSPDLIKLLEERLPATEHLSLFQRSFQSSDLELVEDFYRFGPKRNQQLKTLHRLGSHQILQEQLDDLLALSPAPC